MHRKTMATLYIMPSNVLHHAVNVSKFG